MSAETPPEPSPTVPAPEAQDKAATGRRLIGGDDAQAARPSRRLTARRAQERRVAQPHFSQPIRQIVLMLVVTGLTLAGAWFAYGRILPIFSANV